MTGVIGAVFVIVALIVGFIWGNREAQMVLLPELQFLQEELDRERAWRQELGGDV